MKAFSKNSFIAIARSTGLLIEVAQAVCLPQTNSLRYTLRFGSLFRFGKITNSYLKKGPLIHVS